MTLPAEVLLLMKAINKKMGEGTAVIAGDIDHELSPRFPSGSVSLDFALGGGWPGNQWNELVGEESSGKTAIALKTVVANQQRDPNFLTVWISAEGWVPSYATMMGVDLDRVLLIETCIMEEAYEAAISFAESRTVDCIVIDSLPALIPMTEDDKNMDEMTVGRGALLTNKFFRKVGLASKRSLIKEERPMLGIVINQWRSLIGVMHGDPRTTPGGKGKNFAFFTRVDVKRNEWLEVSKRKVGQTIRFRVFKNKTAPGQTVAEVDFYFSDGENCKAGEFDFAKELVALGTLYGLIKRGGAWFTYGDIKTQGLEAMLQAIREESSAKEQLETEVMEIASRKGGPKVSSDEV